MNTSLYIPSSFFLLRIPIRPFEEYARVLSEKNWIQSLFDLYESNPSLQEAIFIASPSLYSALNKKPYKNPKKHALSLLKYVLRMSTRATPFGLFSFVSTGSWTQETISCFNTKEIYKKSRPDMEWLYSLIYKLYAEEDDDVISSLSIHTNPLITFGTDKIYVNYIRKLAKDIDEAKSVNTISIQQSLLVKTILDLAKEDIEINTLWNKLVILIPALERKKTLLVIRNLIAHQFLLPGILPNLMTHFSLEDFWRKLPTSLSISKEIREIVIEVENYNQTSLGHGKNNLQNLTSLMEKVVHNKHLLHVDSGSEKQFSLPSMIASELGDALTFMWRLFSHQLEYTYLDNYHIKFLEKYGLNRSIPLLDLLDEKKGLGTFETQRPSVNTQSEFTQQWEKWLSIQWQECLKSNKKEIILEEHLIDHLCKVSKEKVQPFFEAISSLDIFCKIIANTPKDLDNGNYSILFLQSSLDAGSSMGRFLDVLDERFEKNLTELLKAEANLKNNITHLQISFWPSLIRIANVAIGPAIISHYLDSERGKQGNNSYGLEDIYVGTTGKRFYLTLKDGSIEIEAQIKNLVNLKYAPLPIKFMREVTIAKYRALQPFSWGSLEESAVFLPRVCFRKTILSPARWRLNTFQFSKESLKETISQFHSWKKLWELPEKVFLVEGDKNFLLNLTNPIHLEEIATRIHKNEPTSFSEHFDETWMKSEQGTHTPEIIVPFIKNPIYKLTEPATKTVPYQAIATMDRVKFPGSEWLYVKFYLNENEFTHFLIQYLYKFAEKLKVEEKIVKWFFVRYKDPEPHIRFRIHLINRQALASILFSLEKSISEWLTRGVIKTVEFAEYEREIEKYGGLENIEQSEEFFYADSLAAIHFLQAFSNQKIITPSLILHVLSGVNFLQNLLHNEEKMITFFANQELNLSDLHDFREHKAQLISLIKNLKEDVDFSCSPEIVILRQCSHLMSSAIDKLQSQLQHLSYDEIWSIYNNMLHIHYNRRGVIPEVEKKVRMYTLHALTSIKKASSYVVS